MTEFKETAPFMATDSLGLHLSARAIWSTLARFLPGGHHGLAQAAICVELGLVKHFLDTSFCLEALDESFKKYGHYEIFNSDQRVQFTSKVFVEELQPNKVLISIDGKSRCYDNIFIECLWHSLKYQEVYLKSYDLVREAKISIGNYFNFYNHIRAH